MLVDGAHHLGVVGRDLLGRGHAARLVQGVVLGAEPAALAQHLQRGGQHPHVLVGAQARVVLGDHGPPVRVHRRVLEGDVELQALLLRQHHPAGRLVAAQHRFGNHHHLAPQHQLVADVVERQLGRLDRSQGRVEQRHAERRPLPVRVVEGERDKLERLARLPRADRAVRVAVRHDRLAVVAEEPGHDLVVSAVVRPVNLDLGQQLAAHGDLRDERAGRALLAVPVERRDVARVVALRRHAEAGRSAERLHSAQVQGPRPRSGGAHALHELGRAVVEAGAREPAREPFGGLAGLAVLGHAHARPLVVDQAGHVLAHHARRRAAAHLDGVRRAVDVAQLADVEVGLGPVVAPPLVHESAHGGLDAGRRVAEPLQPPLGRAPPAAALRRDLCHCLSPYGVSGSAMRSNTA